MPRRNSTQLSDYGIQRLAKPPKGERREKFDRSAPGLALRITDNGTKSWSVYYRHDGRHQRMTLGEWHGHLEGDGDSQRVVVTGMGVTEARTLARKVKDQAKAGIDPKMAREIERAEARAQIEARAAALMTFGRVAEKYIDLECAKLKRGQETESIIRRVLMPEWEQRPIMLLRPRDANSIINGLIKAGKPSAGYRAYETIKRVFNWALDADEIDDNPMARLKRPFKKEPRDRDLKDDEIKAVWAGAEEMAYPFGPLYQVLLLTGQRLSEVAGMRWSEIGPDKAEWTIPKERAKNNVAHIVPLSSSVMAILKALPRFAAGDFVFTTTSGRRPVSGFSKTKERFDEKVKIEPWRVHDLRRTCRTGLAKLSVGQEIAERVLNHIPAQLVRTYDRHDYLDEKRDALERWGRHVESVVTPPPENVVKLKARPNIENGRG